MSRSLLAAWIVFRKELLDALRDRRTLLMVLLSSVAVGPVVLVALSGLVAAIEERSEQRRIVVAGAAQAPTLVNYLQRQALQVEPAPADFERRLRDERLDDAVVVVQAGFEAELARGELPAVRVFTSSANQRAQASAARVMRVLGGFASERAGLRLAMRGVAPGVLDVVDLQERDLASRQSRGARFTAMLPFFVLMAVLYGALSAALDTTAGERERGSLEPLLANPAPRAALVLGKWGAVAAVAMLIALLSCFGFVPAQGLLRSETLAALFHFGLREAALFLALLAPLAAALSALLMAVAIRCRTYKEAQANNTVVILLVSLLPLASLFNPGAEADWHRWVPALGQLALMNRVLQGEAVAAPDMLAPLAVCVLVTAAGLAYVAGQLRAAAVR